MQTTEKYLTQLQTDKHNLVEMLNNKGIVAEDTETFTSLVPKVEDIKGVEDYFTETIGEGLSSSVSGFLRALKRVPAFSVSGTSCRYMFSWIPCEEIDLSKFDTSEVTDMSYMFYHCENITGLDVSNLDTHNATTVLGMFSECQKLTYIDISSFDFSNTTTMASMFYRCYRLESIKMPESINSITTSLASMFESNRKLKGKIDLSCLKCPNVKSTNRMFYFCDELEEIDLSNLETPELTNAEYMFVGSKLQKIDIRKMTFDKITSSYEMFGNLPSTCLIIVKSQKEKDWMTDKFPRYTNIKTADEATFEEEEAQITTDLNSILGDNEENTTLDISYSEAVDITNSIIGGGDK